MLSDMLSIVILMILKGCLKMFDGN